MKIDEVYEKAKTIENLLDEMMLNGKSMRIQDIYEMSSSLNEVIEILQNRRLRNK